MMRSVVVSICVLGGLLSAGYAGEELPPASDYGFDFETIGDPGNRDTTLEETVGYWGFPLGVHIGGVDYEYRIATTEVTIEQYFEFVVAYLPLYLKNTGHNFGHFYFTGPGIHTTESNAKIRDGISGQRAAKMGWEYAARYINWLHNGKVNKEWAFETGVYDTSTFGLDDKGEWTHQEFHHPDARFWMPTRDEWTKAAYWDPELENGAGGYWRYPTSSDVEPIPNLLLIDGGERNAGLWTEGWPLDTVSFPDMTSPWGMYDMAGGESEFLETTSPNGGLGRRAIVGSAYTSYETGDVDSLDILGLIRYITAAGDIHGLRLASVAVNPADLNQDGRVNYFDMSVFIERFVAGDLEVDFDGDGDLDVDDVFVFIEMMGAG